MELKYRKEHLECFNYNKGEKPLIEVVKILKFEKKKISINSNEVVFVLEGKLRYTFNSLPEYELVEGEIGFLHAGQKVSYEAIYNVTLVVFRITRSIQLCDTFPIEKLYNPEEHTNIFRPRTRNWFGVLEINIRLQHFVEEVKNCLSDGLKCLGYFEIKIKELFYLFRVYYGKEELKDFFFLILSEDTAFSEYVRLRWKQFQSIGEMAKSMQLSHKQFSKRFIAVFGETPQKWIMEAKAQNIYNEIMLTDKLFKQIATENGLGSDTHFTWFCKKTFGKTPSDIRKSNGKI